MNIGISKLIEDADLLLDQRRLTLAKDTLEEARRLTKIPERRAWITYNLGILYWVHFGDGVNAKCEFLSVVKDFEIYGYGKNSTFKIMHANAVENAMVLALSYDEFEELAEKLRVLSPNEPILSALFPEVQECRGNGISWAEVLLRNATSFYNRTHPKLDAGLYGEAMSIYHLLLANRQRLRLKRENWRIALVEYCVLSLSLSSKCQLTRGGENDFNSPEEFLPIVTKTLPFIDEYLASNSGEKNIKELKDGINEFISLMRQRWSEISSSNSKFQMSRRKANFEINQQPITLRKEKKGIFSLIFPVICTVIGIWLGGLWGGVIGMFIGLVFLLVSNFSTKYVRHFRCDFCGRLFEKITNPNEFMQGMGVTIRTDRLMSGQEGIGYECVKCQRTLCSNCETFDMKCKCGSVKFRSVHLVYR